MSAPFPIPVFRIEEDAATDRALAAAAARVIASRRFILASEVDAFEREFADFCGTSEAIGVASGSDALELALRAIDIGPGSRVATVANAGYYTTSALVAIGAEAVFVDVDATLTMSPSALAAVIADVHAVVVTHLYGRLANVDAIVALASRHGVAIVEDCAHAHGALRNGKRAGSFGIAGCFSFYPTKNLGALGDGGAVVTSDAAVARRVRALRQHGWASKYVVQHAGGRNSRLDEMQAAFLRVKLPALDAQNAARASIARHYRRAFLDLGILLPDAPDGEYVAHLFVIRARDRALLQSRLSDVHIASAIHYPVPDYRQPACPFAQRSALPITEAACDEVLSLPCYPGLSQDDAESVIHVVREHCLRPSPH